MYTFPSGNTYTGEWKDDMKHGKGTFHSVNGETYTGMMLERVHFLQV